MHSQLKVLIVDDHPVYRKGLSEMLESFELVEFCHNVEDGEVALERLKSMRYDIVFLDLSMPRMDGMEATRTIRKEYPGVRIIILSMYDSPMQVIELIEMGIHAYVLKTAGEIEIEKALTLVYEGSKYFTPKVNKIWADHLVNKATHELNENAIILSVTEIKILRLICEQYTSKEIADKASIAISTVNNHRSNIMNKLSIHNLVGLVEYAIKNHIYIP